MGAEVYYNLQRWYQPATGRYTRADPVGQDSADQHPYVYAVSNPLAGSDPLGLFRIRGPAPGCAIEYIMRRLPELISHPTIVPNLARISGCSIGEVQNGLLWSSGPEIAIGLLRPGLAGQFNPKKPGEFTINRPATEGACASCSCSDALLGLGISILHEYTHLLYQKCRGLEPEAVIDAGDTFELHTYDPDLARRTSQAFL